MISLNKMEVERQQLDCGTLYSFSTQNSADRYLAFFGNKNSSLEKIREQFPHLNFVILQQTHSDIMLKSMPSDSLANFSREGDAHWTEEKNLAACIRTADCLPILVFDPRYRCVLGIHAGWKGVAARILEKCLNELVLKDKLSPSSTSILFGPHIVFESFEVSRDVAQQLLQAIPKNEDSTGFFKKINDQKDLVDLLSICKAQARHQGISDEHFYTENTDTLTNNEFSSFRRDKESAGRQISFIARI